MEIIYIFSNITFVASYVEVWEKWLISGLSQAGGLAWWKICNKTHAIFCVGGRYIHYWLGLLRN